MESIGDCSYFFIDGRMDIIINLKRTIERKYVRWVERPPSCSVPNTEFPTEIPGMPEQPKS